MEGGGGVHLGHPVPKIPKTSHFRVDIYLLNNFL